MPGVAVIGASERRIPWTAWLLDSLAQYGYGDPVWLVNPGHQELLGRPCLPALEAVPGDPDVGGDVDDGLQVLVRDRGLLRPPLAAADFRKRHEPPSALADELRLGSGQRQAHEPPLHRVCHKHRPADDREP